MVQKIRIGIVGAGANTRLRHVPGFRALDSVEIVGVVNRTSESTRRAATELGIAKCYEHWQQLVDDPGIDAVMVGTWPYLHAPITIAALDAGKHVLTEARMALNAAESHAMYQASLAHPNLVAMIVPSPFGFYADRVVRRLLSENYIGPLREVVVLATDDSRLSSESPLHWRQIERYSGVNMLQLGILHETLTRWVPEPIRVLAQSQTFIRQRLDSSTNQPGPVETPDSVHVLTQLPNGAQGVYHLSAVTRFGPGQQIHIYGTEGTLKYELAPRERLLGGRLHDKLLHEIAIPEKDVYRWRVEAEFIGAIRGEEPVQYTDFRTGVRYMEFTEAVTISAATGRAVALPLPTDQL
jgi:predicted dehydrogenase